MKALCQTEDAHAKSHSLTNKLSACSDSASCRRKTRFGIMNSTTGAFVSSLDVSVSRIYGIISQPVDKTQETTVTYAAVRVIEEILNIVGLLRKLLGDNLANVGHVRMIM